MSETIRSLCLACCLVVVTPAFAVNPNLQVAVSGLSGQTVTVSVHNPTTGTLSARVSIDVVLNDATLTTLTSSNFTVSAGTTISVALSASHPIVEIEDNPEPIGIAE